MMPSATLQSKILKTKKRLSSDSLIAGALWLPILSVLAVVAGLGSFLSYHGGFGVVKTSFPVLHYDLEDPTPRNFQQTYSAELTDQSVAILVTTEAIFFGTLAAFTTEYFDVRNKFSIKHEQGSPQLGRALAKIDTWLKDRTSRKSPINSDVAVLITHGAVPAPIVIQILHGLNQSRLFGHTILGTGLM